MNKYHVLRKTLFVGLGVFVIAFLVDLGTQDQELASALYPIVQTASVKDGLEQNSKIAQKSPADQSRGDLLSKEVYMGVVSPIVFEFETQLKKKGFFQEEPDNLFEQSTQQALVEFQKSQKIEPTGELTNETFITLFQ